MAGVDRTTKLSWQARVPEKPASNPGTSLKQAAANAWDTVSRQERDAKGAGVGGASRQQ